MTDMTLNTNVNMNFNFNFGAASLSPADSFALQVGKGIMAMFSAPLGAGPFASAQMPNLFNVTVGMLLQGQAQTPVFEPQAQFTASMDSDHSADIDLGDGYTMSIDENSSEIVINNANTGETTRIWGDPHVQVDGKHVYDFWGKTTFTLENGTKITIDTEPGKNNPNVYFAETVTVTKGDQAIIIDGVSQQTKGDLSVEMSNNGEMIDAMTGDGFVLHENATGSGWRSELTSEVATQADLNATKPGELYGPGSQTPSLGEMGEMLSTFLFFGFAGAMIEEVSSSANQRIAEAFRFDLV